MNLRRRFMNNRNEVIERVRECEREKGNENNEHAMYCSISISAGTTSTTYRLH